MKYKLCLTIVALFVFIDSFAQTTTSVMSYFDGSGNAYIVTTDSIEYIPVKKEKSSSGVYDGGVNKKKSITKLQHEKVKKEFDAIFKNKNIQIKNRIMTSGVLVIKKGKKTDEVIVKQSKEQKQLEELLFQIINL